jgi:hypothetical protein
MATHQTPPQPAARPSGPKPLKVVQHSQLFYWWPVWLVSFILGIISFADGSHMVPLPAASVVAVKPETVKDAKGADVPGYSIKVPGDPNDPNVLHRMQTDGSTKRVDTKLSDAESPFPIRMSDNKNLGVIWAVTLVLVIFITNVPLRGMWSVVVLVSLVLLSIIFVLAGWWAVIISWFSFLGIFMNAGGYFFIGIALLIFWVLTVFLFDQQTYWIFTPGQLRIHEAIGGGEKAFDTRGMTTEKHRDDLFRHWILGLGTGDLTVKTAGAESREFRIQNVWWVGHKLTQIQELQRIHQEMGAGRH